MDMLNGARLVQWCRDSIWQISTGKEKRPKKSSQKIINFGASKINNHWPIEFFFFIYFLVFLGLQTVLIGISTTYNIRLVTKKNNITYQFLLERDIFSEWSEVERHETHICLLQCFLRSSPFALLPLSTAVPFLVFLFLVIRDTFLISKQNK